MVFGWCFGVFSGKVGEVVVGGGVDGGVLGVGVCIGVGEGGEEFLEFGGG